MKIELQAKICNCILLGKSNPEIAEILFVSESTVKNYLNKMYKESGIVRGNKRIQLLALLYSTSGTTIDRRR